MTVMQHDHITFTFTRPSHDCHVTVTCCGHDSCILHTAGYDVVMHSPLRRHTFQQRPAQQAQQPRPPPISRPASNIFIAKATDSEGLERNKEDLRELDHMEVGRQAGRLVGVVTMDRQADKLGMDGQAGIDHMGEGPGGLVAVVYGIKLWVGRFSIW